MTSTVRMVGVLAAWAAGCSGGSWRSDAPDAVQDHRADVADPGEADVGADDDGGAGGEADVGAEVDADADGDVGADGGVSLAPGPIAVGGLAGSHQNPCWSPGGDRLVFTRFRSGYNTGLSDLAVVDARGGAAERLTTAEAQNVNLPGSCWSVPRERIVYTTDDVDRDEVWLVSPGSGTPARVTDRPGSLAWEPSFSPDGAWIVFESHDETGGGEGSIWKVRVDGSGPGRLTSGASDDREPNWSPRGDRIVFQSLAGGTWDVWTMSPDGGDRVQVTASDGDETDPSFSPDGRHVVYSGDAGLENADLFVVAEGGGPPVRLHVGGTTTYAGAPSWSPDGRWISYEACEGDPDASPGTHLEIVAAPVF